MKIKRWAVYDGIAGEYYPRRFIFRANAVRAVTEILNNYESDLVSLDDVLTHEEIDSVKIVELA